MRRVQNFSGPRFRPSGLRCRLVVCMSVADAARDYLATLSPQLQQRLVDQVRAAGAMAHQEKSLTVTALAGAGEALAAAVDVGRISDDEAAIVIAFLTETAELLLILQTGHDSNHQEAC